MLARVTSLPPRLMHLQRDWLLRNRARARGSLGRCCLAPPAHGRQERGRLGQGRALARPREHAGSPLLISHTGGPAGQGWMEHACMVAAGGPLPRRRLTWPLGQSELEGWHHYRALLRYYWIWSAAMQVQLSGREDRPIRGRANLLSRNTPWFMNAGMLAGTSHAARPPSDVKFGLISTGSHTVTPPVAGGS